MDIDQEIIFEKKYKEVKAKESELDLLYTNPYVSNIVGT